MRHPFQRLRALTSIDLFTGRCSRSRRRARRSEQRRPKTHHQDHRLRCDRPGEEVRAHTETDRLGKRHLRKLNTINIFFIINIY